MSVVRTIRSGELHPQCAAISQPTNAHGDLAEPLQVIRLSLESANAARERFSGYRLTRLVGARLELDDVDMGRLSDVIGIDLLRPVAGVLRPFDWHLRQVIENYRLSALFSDDGHAPYHHAIRPTGYDFHCDEVIPIGMQRWRADYREMSDERQMIAASIVWLYRAGKDNVWLRRVPCTWHAADAITCMKAADVLADWARLYAFYPGW
jgi:hypothetical protein